MDAIQAFKQRANATRSTSRILETVTCSAAHRRALEDLLPLTFVDKRLRQHVLLRRGRKAA